LAAGISATKTCAASGGAETPASRCARSAATRDEPTRRSSARIAADDAARAAKQKQRAARRAEQKEANRMPENAIPIAQGNRPERLSHQPATPTTPIL
jgi:hypothetical protein